MLSADQEDAKTLARIIGVTEEEASERLNFRVCVSGGGDSASASAFAENLRQLLALTVTVTPPTEPCDLELSINAACVTQASERAVVSLLRDKLIIERDNCLVQPVPETSIPQLTLKVAACYAAGYALSAIAQNEAIPRLPDRFEPRFNDLGLDPALLSKELDLDDTVVIGAGGVSSGFFWGLQGQSVRGIATIVDPKNVSSGNPNRCTHYDAADVGHPKAVRLSQKININGLVTIPFTGEFADLCAQKGPAKRVIVTVDSRRARRTIQSETPLEVVDASTTGISEVIVHSHRQPTDGACLACIYAHIPKEDERDRSIAEGLGIPLEDLRSPRITPEIADRLVSANPNANLNRDALVGKAFDTLYKELCASEALLTAAGEQALAPFGFISNLAGALLVLEALRLQHGSDSTANYLFLNPWREPNKFLRRWRGKVSGCSFCGKPHLRAVLEATWPQAFGKDGAA